MKNSKRLEDCGLHKSGEVVGFALIPDNQASQVLVREISVFQSSKQHCPRQLQHLLLQTKRGLLLGKCPVLAEEGSGGT